MRKDAAVADDRPHRARHRSAVRRPPSDVPDEELMRALYREHAG
ncbi:RNA polymerase subunit sigma, partial [Streptomyces sp. wa22]